MKKQSLLLLILSVLPIASVYAKDPVYTMEERNALLQNAKVWAQPAWIEIDPATKNFRFSQQFDILTGPSIKAKDRFALDQNVTCDYVNKTTMNGMTEKFFCTIPAEKKPDQIKVKYGVNNGELPGEFLSTRLFWSLGFYADVMYPVKQVTCKNCPSADPFNIRKKDPVMGTSFDFSPAAIERKFDAQEVAVFEDQGWSFNELFNGTLVPSKVQERLYRDALRMLAVFIQHTDNKPEQQRLMCDKKAVDANGKCIGDSYLVVQDLGSTFGHGANGMRMIDDKASVNSKAWASRPIWNRADLCEGFLLEQYWSGGVQAPGSSSMGNPIISEEARQFTGGLLYAFAFGEGSDQRLLDLFQASRAGERMASMNHSDVNQEVAKWIKIFRSKVMEIMDPMNTGSIHNDFKCPYSIVNQTTYKKNLKGFVPEVKSTPRR